MLLSSPLLVTVARRPKKTPGQHVRKVLVSYLLPAGLGGAGIFVGVAEKKWYGYLLTGIFTVLLPLCYKLARYHMEQNDKKTFLVGENNHEELNTGRTKWMLKWITGDESEWDMKRLGVDDLGNVRSICRCGTGFPDIYINPSDRVPTLCKWCVSIDDDNVNQNMGYIRCEIDGCDRWIQGSVAPNDGRAEITFDHHRAPWKAHRTCSSCRDRLVVPSV